MRRIHLDDRCRLATEKLVDRIHNPGLHPDRADIIVGGCCVLVAIMRKLHRSDITVSTTALTDGVASVVRRSGSFPRAKTAQPSGNTALGSLLQDFFS